MKLFNYLKNLFTRKNVTVENISAKPAPTHDVFGDVIMHNDQLVPVEYADVRRRGYLTIKEEFEVYRPQDLSELDIKNVIRLTTLNAYANTRRIKLSRRHGFIHVHCGMQAFK